MRQYETFTDVCPTVHPLILRRHATALSSTIHNRLSPLNNATIMPREEDEKLLYSYTYVEDAPL